MMAVNDNGHGRFCKALRSLLRKTREGRQLRAFDVANIPFIRLAAIDESEGFASLLQGVEIGDADFQSFGSWPHTVIGGGFGARLL